MSNPQTPDVPVTTRKRTPKSAPARAGDGLTMYERAKLQIAERERKLKALQDKLMEDCTFTPQSTSNSIASSVVSSPEKVFERLYNVETAAMRARRASPRSANNSPTRPRVRGSKDGYVTPTRLQELHVEGQNKLRARKRTQQEEDEERQRRLEEQELSQCTFTPQTKWKIAAERRRKAQEEAQRTADEARARSLRPKTSEREQWQRIQEEEELKKCTFKPNLKWNIVKERRNMSRQPRTLWDDDDDDDEPPVPTQVPRTPRISTKATNIDLSPLTDPRPTANPTSVDQPPQHQESPEKISGYATNIKLVSADNFQEDSGKVTKAPTVVRSNYIGAVVPPSPEWKQKYKKIGPKQTEEVLEAKGSVVVGTMQVRSNFSSTIIAGGQKASSARKSPMETPKKSAHTGVASDAQSRDPLMIPQLAEPDVTAPTLPRETVDNVAAAMESTPSKENRQSWLEGLLQKKGESGEVATEAEHAKKIDTDMDALLSNAEASASAQADALSRKLADEDSAAAAAKANDTKTEVQEPEDKKKSKISTWKQRLLGKRSKSNDLNESGAKDDGTQASGAGTENSETTRADAKANHDTRIKTEEEARLKATEEAKVRAAEEARLKAEEEARLCAAEEARLKAEEEARLIAEEDARLNAEEEALLKAEEARLRAEEEARLIAEEDARLKAEEEALLKAEEARLRAEEEARLIAEEDARLKAEEEALLKAEEARLRAEEEARLIAEEDARLKAEEEALLKAEEARLIAEEDARLKAEEEALLKAEEARLKAEEARLRAKEEARLIAEEDARLKAEEEALLKAEEARLRAEEDARLRAAEVARLKADEEARRKAEEDARLKADEEARLKAEEQARLKADEDVVLKASSEDAEALSTDDDEALVGEKPKKADRAKKWKERLARKGSKDDAKQLATTDASPDLMEVRLEPPTEKGDTPLEVDPGAHQSDDDVGGLDGDDEGKSKKKSDRANKWKERLAKRTKGTKSKSKSGTNDDDAPPVAGVESPEKVAYPRVLLNEGDDSQLDKEPEIGSI